MIVLTVAIFTYALRTLALGPNLHHILNQFDGVLSVLFCLEYIARWYSRSCRLTYLLKWEMVVDFVAFLPLVLHIVGRIDDDSNSLGFLRVLRVFRLYRFLRNRESFAQVLGVPTKYVRPFQLQVARTVTSVATLLFVCSGFLYTVEHEINPSLSNFFRTFSFALGVTTVGFGADVAPRSDLGVAIVCLSILSGVTIIPLQLSLLAEAFLQGMNSKPFSGDRDEAVSPRQDSAGSLLVCQRCTAGGHRKDAVFCWRCGASLEAAAAAAAEAAAARKAEEAARKAEEAEVEKDNQPQAPEGVA